MICEAKSEFDCLYPPPGGDAFQDALSAGHTFLTCRKVCKRHARERGGSVRAPLSGLSPRKIIEAALIYNPFCIVTA